MAKKQTLHWIAALNALNGSCTDVEPDFKLALLDMLEGLKGEPFKTPFGLDLGERVSGFIFGIGQSISGQVVVIKPFSKGGTFGVLLDEEVSVGHTLNGIVPEKRGFWFNLNALQRERKHGKTRRMD